MVIEPTGKYLYVTNQSLGQIYAFTIDPVTGLLTAVQGSMSHGEVADPGPMPSGLAVDISGKFLYCEYMVSPGAGNIAIYSIDLSTGFLTFVNTVNVPDAAGFTTTGTVQ